MDDKQLILSTSVHRRCTPAVKLPPSTAPLNSLHQTKMCFNVEQFNCLSPLQKSHRWVQYTLWLFNIAMENGPFIDGLPINFMVIFHG